MPRSSAYTMHYTERPRPLHIMSHGSHAPHNHAQDARTKPLLYTMHETDELSGEGGESVRVALSVMSIQPTSSPTP
jgi:hypothetical protein